MQDNHLSLTSEDYVKLLNEHGQCGLKGITTAMSSDMTIEEAIEYNDYIML